MSMHSTIDLVNICCQIIMNAFTRDHSVQIIAAEITSAPNNTLVLSQNLKCKCHHLTISLDILSPTPKDAHGCLKKQMTKIRHHTSIHQRAVTNGMPALECKPPQLICNNLVNPTSKLQPPLRLHSCKPLETSVWLTGITTSRVSSC
jgi:hypothetical protein